MKTVHCMYLSHGESLEGENYYKFCCFGLINEVFSVNIGGVANKR